MPNAANNFGKLRKLIQFQSPVVTDGDANSDEINTWSDEFTAYAEVEETEGEEISEGDRLTHLQKVKFIVRFDTRIKLTWRIVYGGYAYRILSKSEIGNSAYYKIITEFLDTVTT
jgi:SPP1 family predicted phage head-tail adaptor